VKYRPPPKGWDCATVLSFFAKPQRRGRMSWSLTPHCNGRASSHPVKVDPAENRA